MVSGESVNNDRRLIAAFSKNSVEEIRVCLQTWKAQTYCDIRAWMTDQAGETGTERPTHKGITFNVEVLDKLIEALQAARAVIEGQDQGPRMGGGY